MRLPLLFFAFSTAAVTFSAPCLLAQEARETSVKIAKAPQPALLADYNYPADAVEAALKARLQANGFGSGSSSRGFTVYKGVQWTEVSADKLDVYTRVDGKDGKSTITMLLSKGYDNFVSGTTDAAMLERGKAFLNGLVADASVQSLRMSIAAQEEVVRRAEKDARDKSKDGEDLARDLEKLQGRIADNKRDQGARDAKVEEEKGKLETMKTQLSSTGK